MRICIDIGSTVIKIAGIDCSGKISFLKHEERNPSEAVSHHVGRIIENCKNKYSDLKFRICSSANGGLRVGIIYLTSRYSGLTARNLCLNAGANITFTVAIQEAAGMPAASVDALIIVGGVDNSDMPRFKEAIMRLNVSHVCYSILIYAGNAALFPLICKQEPNAIYVENILDVNLKMRNEKLTECVRNLYLDDLIDRSEVTQFQQYSEIPIVPTPSIVNEAFARIAQKAVRRDYPEPFILIDIGGATTDVHFCSELLASQESEPIYSGNFSLYNRYVFTQIGCMSSKQSAWKQFVHHPRAHELLKIMCNNASGFALDENEINDKYLPYIAFFLVLEALSSSAAKHCPHLDFSRIMGIVFTGGIVKIAQIEIFERIIRWFLKIPAHKIKIAFDRNYDIWVDGILSLSQNRDVFTEGGSNAAIEHR